MRSTNRLTKIVATIGPASADEKTLTQLMAAGVDVKFFPLRFADAESLSELIKNMFEEGKKLPEEPAS